MPSEDGLGWQIHSLKKNPYVLGYKVIIKDIFLTDDIINCTKKNGT